MIGVDQSQDDKNHALGCSDFIAIRRAAREKRKMTFMKYDFL